AVLIEHQDFDATVSHQGVEAAAATADGDAVTHGRLGAGQIDRRVNVAILAEGMVEDVQDPHQFTALGDASWPLGRKARMYWMSIIWGELSLSVGQPPPSA